MVLTVEWIESQHNYTTDVLRWQTQTDSYSCGFYMLAVIQGFAITCGCLPLICFRSPSFRISERMRKGCIVAFFRTVEQVFAMDDASADFHVLKYLCEKIKESTVYREKATASRLDGLEDFASQSSDELGSGDDHSHNMRVLSANKPATIDGNIAIIEKAG